jgi:DNA-binding cell septation regulator SpoVG
MKITAERREAGRFTFYTVRLATAEGRQPFLEMKDLKIIDGPKGRFVSFPARKDDKDKYWPYMYASDEFQVELIKAMDAASPKDTRTHAERKARNTEPPF